MSKYELRGSKTKAVFEAIKKAGRPVYTGEFGFSADCYAAASAHPGSVYHQRVQADDCRIL